MTIARTLAVAITLLAVGATLSGCGAAPTQPRPSGSTGEPATNTTDPQPTAFDPAKWNSKAVGEGHRLAAARDIVKRDLLKGMSLSDVIRLLGRPDASAIPVKSDPETPVPSAGLSYNVAEGPLLVIHFTDEVVDSVRLNEPAGSPEEAAKISGVWEVADAGALKQLELRPVGFLVRAVDVGGRMKNRVGNWRVVSPGKILCFRPRWAEHTYVAAVYRYKITGTSMVLTWVDERAPLDGPYASNAKWEPWLAGPDNLTLRLDSLDATPTP